MFQWHSSPPSLVEYSVGVAHVRTNHVYYNVIITHTHTHTHTSADSVWSHSGEASSSPIVGSPSSNGRGTTLMGDAVREEGRRGCVYNITSLLSTRQQWYLLMSRQEFGNQVKQYWLLGDHLEDNSMC